MTEKKSLLKEHWKLWLGTGLLGFAIGMMESNKGELPLFLLLVCCVLILIYTMEQKRKYEK